MKRPFMVWIGFISICCSKAAKEGKSCPRFLALQRVAQNAKNCSKVAEHNLFMPTGVREILGSIPVGDSDRVYTRKYKRLVAYSTLVKSN